MEDPGVNDPEGQRIPMARDQGAGRGPTIKKGKRKRRRRLGTGRLIKINPVPEEQEEQEYTMRGQADEPPRKKTSKRSREKKRKSGEGGIGISLAQLERYLIDHQVRMGHISRADMKLTNLNGRLPTDDPLYPAVEAAQTLTDGKGECQISA